MAKIGISGTGKMVKKNNQLKVIKNTWSYVESAVNDGWSDFDAS